MDLGQSLQKRLELTQSPSLQMEEQEKWAKWQASQPLPRVPTGDQMIESGLKSALSTAGKVGSFMAAAPSDLVTGLAKGGVSQVLQTGHDIVRLGENVAQLLAPTPAGALKMRKQAMGTGEGSVTEPVGTVQALSHPVGQFLSMFVPGTSALKGAGMGTKGAAALSGFMADFASDPEAGNLANLAGDAYNAFSPEGQLALVEWLGTNKNAPELENRLKNAFLGSATGLGVDAVMSGLKMLKTRGQMNKLGETIRQAFAEAQGQRGSAVMGPSDEMVTLFRHGDVKGPTANFGESEGMVAPFAQAGPLRSLQVSKSDAETFRKSNLLKNPNVEQAIKDEILKQGGMPDLEYLLPDWLARAAKEHYAEGGLGAVLEALVGER